MSTFIFKFVDFTQFYMLFLPEDAILVVNTRNEFFRLGLLTDLLRFFAKD